MPIEIRRFGVGHRRADGPPGSVGVTGQVIHSDGRGVISILAADKLIENPRLYATFLLWLLSELFEEMP